MPLILARKTGQKYHNFRPDKNSFLKIKNKQITKTYFCEKQNQQTAYLRDLLRIWLVTRTGIELKDKRSVTLYKIKKWLFYVV